MLKVVCGQRLDLCSQTQLAVRLYGWKCKTSQHPQFVFEENGTAKSYSTQTSPQKPHTLAETRPGGHRSNFSLSSLSAFHYQDCSFHMQCLAESFLCLGFYTRLLYSQSCLNTKHLRSREDYGSLRVAGSTCV